jgi:hypothetical protein
VFFLEADLTELHAAAAASDLEALGSGVLGTVAQRLKATAEGGDKDARIAERALRKLFALARRAQVGGTA